MSEPKFALGKCYESWRDSLLKSPEMFVFAYGSLMWRPEFRYAEKFLATAEGVSRRYCIISTIYRGTEESPGRVLGLVRGGTCQGMAFRVAKDDIAGVFDALWSREMVTKAYQPALLPVRRQGDGSASVEALTFLADESHHQYTSAFGGETVCPVILTAHGSSGSNLDYFLDTCRHLAELGVEDDYLHRLSETLNPSGVPRC